MNIGDRIRQFFDKGGVQIIATGGRPSRGQLVRRIGKLAAVGAIAVPIAACSGIEAGPKQAVGSIAGAVAGGYLGSKVGGGSGRLIATGAGTLLGWFVGSEVGKSLDRADQLYAERAAQRAHYAPVGETIHWHNPNSGARGSVTPIRSGTAANGAPCRQYETTVTIDGRTERAIGTACQRRDGTWQIVEADEPAEAPRFA